MRSLWSWHLVMGVTACVSAAALAAEPTKEQAVAHLQGLVAALEAKDLEKAATFVAAAPGVTPDQAKKSLERLLAGQEISREGIEILSAQGTWGKLAEVKAEKGPNWAKKFNVPLEECYVLAHKEGAEAAFHFDGKGLKIIRCDDIGKLKK